MSASFSSPSQSPAGGRRSSLPVDPALQMSDPLQTFGEYREAETGLFTSSDLGDSGLNLRRVRSSGERSRHSYDSKGSGSRSSGGKRARARKHDSGTIIAAQWLTIFTLLAALASYAAMGPKVAPAPPPPRGQGLREAAAQRAAYRADLERAPMPLNEEERAEAAKQAAAFAEEKVNSKPEHC